MGRTVRDSARLQTRPNAYEIVRRQDGSFDVFLNGEIKHRSVPERWLEDELAMHGICGREYREAVRQLSDSGRAKLTF